MLDFKELPDDGIKFEQLVREILIRNGLETHWTGVGPDGGRDLVVIEKARGKLGDFQRKWLVSCKHNANSGASVGIKDIADFSTSCVAIGAQGFLLACSTQPASSVVQRLKEVESQGTLTTKYWDSIEIEKLLRTPMTLPLVHLFLPESAKKIGWVVYNTFSPDVWAANFKDYFIYLSSRTAHSFPSLDDAEKIIERLESVPLPKGKEWERHYLRPRKIFYDNKHDNYAVDVDYLYPHGKEKEVLDQKTLEDALKEGSGLYSDDKYEWKSAYWTIRYQETSQISDHFHLDHKAFYKFYSARTDGIDKD